jgi:hypothetical protein
MTPERINAFFRRIGSCRKCMREAFLAAAAVWVVVPFAALAAASASMPALTWLAFVAATLLTANWLLHLVIFASRAARARRGGEPEHANPRRQFLRTFAVTFGGVALATMLPANSAYANTYFLCITPFCEGNSCCPSFARYLSHCDCLCYRTSSEFSCGSYSYCNGTCN